MVMVFHILTLTASIICAFHFLPTRYIWQTDLAFIICQNHHSHGPGSITPVAHGQDRKLLILITTFTSLPMCEATICSAVIISIWSLLKG
jgi:hypothetical protein